MRRFSLMIKETAQQSDEEIGHAMANAIINRSSVMGLSLLMSEYGRRAQVSSRRNFQDICKIVYAVYRCGGERI